jgi:hypothetical protein
VLRIEDPGPESDGPVAHAPGRSAFPAAKEFPMKLTLIPAKPRNPFVRHARLRLAGPHRRSAASLRQRAARELRAELASP